MTTLTTLTQRVALIVNKPVRKAIPARVRREVIERAGGRCEIKTCRASLPCIEIDHKLPVWAGGDNDLSNLQVLCAPCHAYKTKRDVREFAKSRRGLSKRIKRKAKMPFHWLKKKLDGSIINRKTGKIIKEAWKRGAIK